MLARERASEEEEKKEEEDEEGFWLNVHAHDRSSKCILILDAEGMGLHYVGVSTNTHARLRKRLREADAMLKRGTRPRTPNAFARPPLLLHTRHTSA